MTKTTRAVASPAEQPFHKHFAAMYGEERWWKALYPALAESTRYAAVINRYAVTSDSWRTSHDVAPTRTTEGGDGGVSNHQAAFDAMALPKLSDAADSDSHPHCFTRPLPSKGSIRADPTVPAYFPQPTIISTPNGRLTTHWNLDGASALIAHLLDVKPGDSVLDLCAAPGGKSVILAQNLWPALHVNPSTTSASQPGRLVSNEIDSRRHKRLAENLECYMPGPLIKDGLVKTTNIDATSSGPAVNALVSGGDYDKVLVDAPCSSERHIIHASTKQPSGRTAPEMSSWRAGTSKRLAKIQVDLLMTALKAVKVGGKVMYATCSLEPAENDGVVEKMMQGVEKEGKKGAKWSVQLDFGEGGMDVGLREELHMWAEPTRYGWIVLPDHAGGGKWGPLFFCRMTKGVRT